MPARRTGESIQARKAASPDEEIIDAIKNRLVIKFGYKGAIRIVEPQAYGLSKKGSAVLRGYQVAGESNNGPVRGLRLYQVSEMSNLARTDTQFLRARPEHNPHDSAMSQVIATLPLPTSA